MNGRFSKNVVLVLSTMFCWLVAFNGLAQYTNGIYAEFNTSMGSYTCRLEYALAPKTVANFIGLATGQRAWLDLSSGVVNTNPFFDGTTFHRVITGFMNQGGSPNGLGTDGPGYQFTDEFTPSLRHDGLGVLSMANSGPDSNGSQYFITVSAQPHLDDVHTVFGRLYGGSNIVYAINHVATDANNKPLTNVVLHSVTIRRIGAAALGFDITTNGLPEVTSLQASIARAGTNLSLTFSNRVNTDNRLYISTNLANWTGSSLGIETSSSLTNTLFLNVVAPRQFFRLAQVQYPPTLYVPRNLFGRTFTLNFSGGNGTFAFNFDALGGGTYSWTLGSPGAIAGYYWIQDPYRGRLRPILLENYPYHMELHLDYDTSTAGTFRGTAYYGNFVVSGTFTSSP
jgi:peptidyl-prolyl cis-trans isomerase A (cyclophilin A)